MHRRNYQLALHRKKGDMRFAHRYDLGRRRPVSQASVSAHKGNPRRVEVIHHTIVVDVANHIDIYVVDVSVVVERVIAPVAAFITHAAVAKAIVHAAVEPDVRPPVAVVPVVAILIVAPVTGRPQCTLVRRHHPCAWSPVISLWRVGPVSRCPDIVVARSFGLIVVGKRRRRLGRYVVRRLAVGG